MNEVSVMSPSGKEQGVNQEWPRIRAGCGGASRKALRGASGYEQTGAGHVRAEERAFQAEETARWPHESSE